MVPRANNAYSWKTCKRNYADLGTYPLGVSFGFLAKSVA